MANTGLFPCRHLPVRLEQKAIQLEIGQTRSPGELAPQHGLSATAIADDRDAFHAAAARKNLANPHTGAQRTAHGARLRKSLAVREKRSTFSLAPDAPPRPATVTAIGGFLLAGDWIDTGLPATIESAVLSGHRASACAAQGLA